MTAATTGVPGIALAAASTDRAPLGFRADVAPRQEWRTQPRDFALSISGGGCPQVGGPGQELPPLVSVSDVAEFASLLGSPARASMVIAMLQRNYCTAQQLADAAGITAQTASGHIAKLFQAGLVHRVKAGREWRHRISSPDVEAIIRLVYLGGAGVRRRSAGEVTGDLRVARTCVGHVAGQLGVQLARVLTGSEGAGLRRLNDEGRCRLRQLGLDSAILEGASRTCEFCRDWSEQGHHLGGILGRALQDRLVELGWLRAPSAGRVMAVTAAGRAGFSIRFGLELFRR